MLDGISSVCYFRSDRPQFHTNARLCLFTNIFRKDSLNIPVDNLRIKHSPGTYFCSTVYKACQVGVQNILLIKTGNYKKGVFVIQLRDFISAEHT